VILHSTGNGIWDHQGGPSGYTFDDVWGSGPTDIYSVGSGIMHSTGDGNWTPDGNITAKAVWGSSSSDVYVASVSSEVYHRGSDARWRPQQTTAVNMQDIWGTSATDIYAIGTGKIFHSTGDGVWTEQPAPVANGAFLYCIWALPGAIYIGTDDGHVLYSG